MKLTVYKNGEPYVLEYKAPALLSDILASAGVPFDMPCGGKRRCLKCRLIVRGGALPPDKGELDLLSADDLDSGVRYACMTMMTGDAEIRLTSHGRDRIQTSGETLSFTPNPWASGIGAAFDIGTTTVAAYLYDLSSAELLASASSRNPQAVYGADVISRIGSAVSGKSTQLAMAVRGCINKLINELTDKSGRRPNDIGAIVLTGNTAMEYMLTGESPVSLASAPFIPNRYFGDFYTSAQLGINAPQAKIYLTRCISGYVGGDITSGILSQGILNYNEPVVMADIGTNGEIVLYADNRLYVCSTAAGPAFEGAGIYMGMTAADGAICRVKTENGNLAWESIGQSKPKGICGSGVIDAVAAALELDIIDETGLIDDDASNVIEADGLNAIAFPGSEIVLTQKDIRAVQLAKSAICSGITVLISAAGLNIDEIRYLLIAGGFGTTMNIQSAQKIGLIPPGFSERSRAVGNAAGMGAASILLSREKLKESEDVARMAIAVDLSLNKNFKDAYIENMMF